MALKIKPHHYHHILGQFKTLTESEIRKEIRNAKALNVADSLANRYVRHTLMDRRISAEWIHNNLYPYMNDTHLDSALKKISLEANIPQIYDQKLESA